MPLLRPFFYLLLGGLFHGSFLHAAEEASSWKSSRFWFGRPAQWKDTRPQQGTGDNSWAKDATPIGNGRIGALIYGGVEKDRMELTEISMWSGGYCSTESKDKGPDSLKFGSYQPFGTLEITYPAADGATDYRRTLDVAQALASVTYGAGGVRYRREYFASIPHQVISMTVQGDKPRSVDAAFRLTTLHPQDRITATAGGGRGMILMQGTLKNGLAYEARIAVLPEGGSVRAEDGSIIVRQADSCRVLVSLATDYVLSFSRNWKGVAPRKRNEAILARALRAFPAQLKAAHQAAYGRLYNRVSLDLGETDDATAGLPVNKRLEKYRQAVDAGTDARDPDLEELVFNFGRYIIISSSQPGNLPANLQGLWNYSLIPPWDSDYHNNINIQMCYWGVFPVNLAECYAPLLDYIREMAPAARKITREAPEFRTAAGQAAPGWTARTAQNIYGGQGFKWNKPASAWYALHLWEHYLFTLDREYLKTEAYPMMKEICRFWESQLKTLHAGGSNFRTEDRKVTPDVAARDLKDVKEGMLVAPMGWSPEHGPREDGCAHDQQIVWELFNNTVHAAEVLGVDTAWKKELAAKRDLLVGPWVGEDGLLMEWMIARKPGISWDPHHRHTSHLFAVYPGSQISPEKTPEWAEAARKSLLARGTTGDSRRSWTWAWRANLWARFLDGNKAYEMIRGMIRYSMMDSLFTTHPPMQVDGTMGIVAGFAEMLLQSHTGRLHLVPALPDAWKNGRVSGLKARGNISVDMAWKDGRVTQFSLSSPVEQDAGVIVNGKEKTLHLKPGVPVKGN
ncbi:glycoside hydrolase N-terminal domain-containing protein [Akkermansia sp.]|uniref:glycoside hydrolase family 95 protein n=1 Tax=Akkermansia sp. TaxID=1872421 RepID=UPI0025C1880A|nr:glycoside hydrolase N-terminal domain-containing protein [Akkermansia sp.]MCC8149329.1 glycoside hydrolase N-terminal domain-containing protein [Akkermansia sp.]